MNGPRFLVTVDVEDFFLPRPPADTYRGSIGSRAWGTPAIMDLVEDVGGKATFFVDVYNRTTVDGAFIAGVLREIDGRGHEVALHTHPAFPSGRRGYGMAQTMQALDAAAQLECVGSGVEFIRDAIGRAPVSHRAGGYGANRDTLRALAAHGIRYDSSLLHGYPHCSLNEPHSTVNTPVVMEGVLELPVSVTRCELALGPWRFAPRLVGLIKKLDPDWCSPGELVRQARALMEAGQRDIVLFLHSYSFLDLEKGFAPRPDRLDAFHGVLRRLREELQGRFVTVAEAGAAFGDAPPASPDALPVVRSDLLWRDFELTRWLAGRVRPRHLRILWPQRRQEPA